MAIYSTNCCGETYRIQANFAEASSQIQRETEDGWEDTGQQVADFRHSPEAAMRAELETSLNGYGASQEECQSEIDDAIASMEHEDRFTTQISVNGIVASTSYSASLDDPCRDHAANFSHGDNDTTEEVYDALSEAWGDRVAGDVSVTIKSHGDEITLEVI